MVWLLILAILGVAVFAITWAFRWAPRIDKKRLETADMAAHLAAALVTSVAIATAALVYTLEQQWSPRFAVELAADARGAPDTIPKAAVLQLRVAITNQGRTAQTINNIEVAAVGLAGPKLGLPTKYGDLPGTVVYHFTSQREKTIAPGETDYAYFEAPVRCYWKLLRVQVKVPQPPFNPVTPQGQRPVYQRKMLVQLADACTTASSETISSQRG